ncbi:conserved hypothetical protein [Thermotomaculum hydrothermale]|uniref:Fumarylacetoacetase-like C-terminal domain-containing protein n=1 Tax=Thermotomaculum hydrothermale TaxID=981385 RepID=A0A7R6PMI0_9BACT|nr:fumarylacetoacetate hydrolase family protein [Thermotomaculum hydrothermale]BBB31836.1 conserved hypothetical protein [Thermotomaculum hydrothermale]
MDLKNMYFVGRNYVEHAKELNNEVPEKPLIFCKPLSTLSEDNNIILPFHSNEVHFEGEMVFKFSKDGYYHVSCGIDYTARDVQNEIKKKGWPWFEAKCFKNSTVLNKNFVKIEKEKLDFLSIETYLNGELKQKGNYTQTIFKIDFLFDYLDKIIGLKEGDIVFTGTPSGVGKVKKGDILKVLIKLEGKLISEVISEVK